MEKSGLWTFLLAEVKFLSSTYAQQNSFSDITKKICGAAVNDL